jgi:hypothetical protein
MSKAFFKSLNLGSMVHAAGALHCYSPCIERLLVHSVLCEGFMRSSAAETRS